MDSATASSVSSDDSVVLDNIAAEINHPHTMSIFTAGECTVATHCGGCGSSLVGERIDDKGRSVREFACGHRYIIGRRTVLIERT
jgi:hypothetical protein